jgi:hypothetical protein
MKNLGIDAADRQGPIAGGNHLRADFGEKIAAQSDESSCATCTRCAMWSTKCISESDPHDTLPPNRGTALSGTVLSGIALSGIASLDIALSGTASPDIASSAMPTTFDNVVTE